VKRQLVLLPQAIAEVEEQAAWWAQHHSREQAARWLDAIHKQLESIVLFPESHPLSAECPSFPFVIRDRLLGLGSRPSHRAVFTIVNHTIFVLTVRRATEDRLGPELSDRFPEHLADDWR
jgi:plasmid stabilization system protein ParE